MYVLLFFSLFTILLTHLESKGQLKNGMAIGFVIMTILAVIRYDYGNDYMNYYRSYLFIISHDFSFSIEKLTDIFREPGWTFINFLFKPFGESGFFIMVATLAIFQNWVYYRFVKGYVPIEYRWFAVFVYLFNTSLYVLNMSMLRQGLTITMLVYCIPYILEKKWLKTALIFILFSTVHSSVKFLIPFAFFGFLKFSERRTWIIPAVYAVCFGVFVMSRDLIDQTLMLVSNVEEMQEYADTYIKDDVENSFKLGLGFIINSIPFVTAILFMLRSDASQEVKILVSLACVGSVISPFGQVTQIITRIAYYFQAVGVATIPIVYYWFKPIPRHLLIGIYIMIMMYSYWVFFHSPTWFDHYYNYTTLFSM